MNHVTVFLRSVVAKSESSEELTICVIASFD